MKEKPNSKALPIEKRMSANTSYSPATANKMEKNANCCWVERNGRNANIWNLYTTDSGHTHTQLNDIAQLESVIKTTLSAICSNSIEHQRENVE